MEREEAINKVRQMSLPKETMDILEALAPELKESEDERIIEEIKFAVMQMPSSRQDTKNRCLAWLEKQKEQKPEQYDIDVLEKHITKDSISELAHTVIVRNGWEIVEAEQKPVDFPTTDEEVKEFLETHLKVEVPEKYKTPDFVFSKQEYESHPIISKDTTSVKPAEWSEEDSKRYISIGTTLETSVVLSKEEYDANMAWLRELVTLKKSLRPQSHWKPSEEQMSMLLAVINEPNNAGSESCHIALKSLYNDLMKLM